MHSEMISTKLALAAILLPTVVAGYTWPDPQIDYLETLLYQQRGHRAEAMADGVSPCSKNIFPDSRVRTISAEWFRTAYHDMATADVEAGTGGLDASIGFETNRAENVGTAFNGSTGFFVAHQSKRASMADLIALGAQMALGSCTDGRLQVPFRGGRIDATEAGPPGVPEPQQDLKSHIESFKKQGFNVTEMIGLVACGHSLGGVHGVNFPDIVEHLPEGDERQDFDGTVGAFDNVVAVQFVRNISQNPLAFGHNHETRSDARIFNADGGELIRRMAKSNDFFISTCKDLVERMINTVPRDVQLTETITPIQVKPVGLKIRINDDATMTISGEIRILEDGSYTASRTVIVSLRGPRLAMNVDAVTNPDLVGGALYGNMPEFTFYQFETTIQISESVSSFKVIIVDDDVVTTFDNNGAGFGWDDSVAPQIDDSESCSSLTGDVIDDQVIFTHTLRVAAAVRDDKDFENVVLSMHMPVEIPGTRAVRFQRMDTVMEKTNHLEGTGYTRYFGEFVFKGDAALAQKEYDLVAVGPTVNVTNAFNSWGALNSCPF